MASRSNCLLIPTFAGLMCGVILRMFRLPATGTTPVLPLVRLADRLLSSANRPHPAADGNRRHQNGPTPRPRKPERHHPTRSSTAAVALHSPCRSRSGGRKQAEGRGDRHLLLQLRRNQKADRKWMPRKLAFDVVDIQMRSELRETQDGSLKSSRWGEAIPHNATTRFDESRIRRSSGSPSAQGHPYAARPRPEGMRRKEGPKADQKPPPPYVPHDSKQYLPRVAQGAAQTTTVAQQGVPSP